MVGIVSHTGFSPAEPAYGNESVRYNSGSFQCNAKRPVVNFRITGMDPDLTYTVLVTYVPSPSLSNVNKNPVALWREFTVPAGHPASVLFNAVLWEYWDSSPMLDAPGETYITTPFNVDRGDIALSLYHPDTGEWLAGRGVFVNCSTGVITPLLAGYQHVNSARCHAPGFISLRAPECTVDARY